MPLILRSYWRYSHQPAITGMPCYMFTGNSTNQWSAVPWGLEMNLLPQVGCYFFAVACTATFGRRRGAAKMLRHSRSGYVKCCGRPCCVLAFGDAPRTVARSRADSKSAYLTRVWPSKVVVGCWWWLGILPPFGRRLGVGRPLWSTR
jgi:hypothetical protein